MVCPNCHSKQVIQVQDQHFCINCGQMVPEPEITTKSSTGLAVQANGLPAGVKILPLKDAPVVGEEAKAPATADDATTAQSPSQTEALIQTRARISSLD